MGEREEQGYRDIFKRAVDEAKNFFRDSFDSATSGAGIYLRDGNPSSITGKAAQAINRRQCEVWGKDPTAFRPAWSDQLADICGPYLNDRGLPPPVPEAKSPFVGGQCSCLSYSYKIQIVRQSGALDGTLTLSGRYGPIGQPTFTQQPSGTSPRITQVFYNDGGPTGAGTTCLPQALRLGNSAGRPITITSLRVVDIVQNGTHPPGGCGNPPPEYLPGAPYGPPLPSPPQLVPGDPASPSFDVTVNPDGSIEVCSGDTCITINPGPDGEIPRDEPGGEEPPLEPGNQGQPGSPSGNFQDEAEGEDPTRNLVGVSVQIVSLPNRANQFFNNFETYTKGPYFVFFGGDGGYSQNPEAAIARAEQFYYAPPGCNKWRVVANVGYTLNVVPYYSE